MNKPILGSSDSLKLFPLTYSWAWDYYRLQRKNDWGLEDTAMGEDAQQWAAPKCLSEEERHLFLGVFAQLTTFDVQREDDAGETLLALLDPPELKHYVKRLAERSKSII